MISSLFGSYYPYVSNGLAVLIGLLVILENESVAAYAHQYQQSMAKRFGVHLDETIYTLKIFRIAFYLIGALAIIRGLLNLIAAH